MFTLDRFLTVLRVPCTQFLVFVGYYHLFIPNFADQVYLKGIMLLFILSSGCQTVFAELRNTLHDLCSGPLIPDC